MTKFTTGFSIKNNFKKLQNDLHLLLNGVGLPGRILFLMTCFGLVRINNSCQILSVDGICLSLAIFVMPTPVKTILGVAGL